MESGPRHQCLIYEGAPSKHLSALAAITREKLQQNFRCLHLNSEPMLAGLGSYLAAAGVDVAREVRKGSLVLSSEQSHIHDGSFDLDSLIAALEAALANALQDGYTGFWASGDMSWEMGSNQNLAMLIDYERRLERFFREHPQMSGICQYHADTLPRSALRHGLIAHPSVFINETLSLINPHYAPAQSGASGMDDQHLDAAIQLLCKSGSLGA